MDVRLAVPNLNTSTLDDLSHIVDQMDANSSHIVSLVQLDHQFYATLYAQSGRKHLCEVNQALRNRTKHYLHAYLINRGSTALAQEEQRAILEACQQGDSERAAQLVEEYVMEMGQAIADVVRRRNASRSS
jgi:DNA-binding GntR family transcriptional regulator